MQPKKIIHINLDLKKGREHGEIKYFVAHQMQNVPRQGGV